MNLTFAKSFPEKSTLVLGSRSGVHTIQYVVISGGLADLILLLA